MKYLIISDIHGSVKCLRQALQAAQGFAYDYIVLLGDLLNHGARNRLPDGYAPAEGVDVLNDLATRILCVRGNCDGDVDGMLFNFPCGGPYQYLTVPELKGNKIFITHGHLYDFKSAEGAHKCGLQPGDIVLSGHTHLACVSRCDSGVINVNPGSVSLPRGKVENSFALLDEQGFRILTLAGSEVLRLEFRDGKACCTD